MLLTYNGLNYSTSGLVSSSDYIPGTFSLAWSGTISTIPRLGYVSPSPDDKYLLGLYYNSGAHNKIYVLERQNNGSFSEISASRLTFTENLRNHIDWHPSGNYFVVSHKLVAGNNGQYSFCSAPVVTNVNGSSYIFLKGNPDYAFISRGTASNLFRVSPTTITNLKTWINEVSSKTVNSSKGTYIALLCSDPKLIIHKVNYDTITTTTSTKISISQLPPGNGFIDFTEDEKYLMMAGSISGAEPFAFYVYELSGSTATQIINLPLAGRPDSMVYKNKRLIISINTSPWLIEYIYSDGQFIYNGCPINEPLTSNFKFLCFSNDGRHLYGLKITDTLLYHYIVG